MVIVIVILCLVVAVSLLAAYFFIFKQDSAPLFIVPQDFSNDLENFKIEIESLNESIRLLEGFMGDYFVTLNESGFRELSNITDTLATSCAHCQNLIEEQQLEPAQEILNFVYKNQGIGNPPPELSSLMPQGVILLNSWRDNVAKHIETIDKNLSHASEEFQKIGRVRRSKRNPTSTILGEVRKVVFGTVEETKK